MCNRKGVDRLYGHALNDKINYEFYHSFFFVFPKQVVTFSFITRKLVVNLEPMKFVFLADSSRHSNTNRNEFDKQ